mmetsp:Transcript_44767/g.113337  ORF Transcript_44767/g.113337 Transcript_44767/m.113337 type:complete len:237 (-) Transcript_44767:136-846(-)
MESQSAEAILPAQQAVVLYVLPIITVFVTCASPAMALAFLVGASQVGQELKNVVQRRFSLLSLFIVGLSPFFLLSNYLASNLYLYGIYGAMLATANLLADRLAKCRIWPVLAIWHALNLLTLIGGNLGPILPYTINTNGIVGECLRVSARYGDMCPRGDAAINWCDNVWVSVQLLVAFAYVLLHIIAFFLVVTRVVHHYGGGSDGDFDSNSFRHTTGLMVHSSVPNSGALPSAGPY